MAGILNQTADRILFPYIYKNSDVNTQLGIYGAASKIAMIMALITQAFPRYATAVRLRQSPGKQQQGNFAKVMKSVIFTLFAYLMVIGYMDILKFIIGRDYWDGLRVVPIVMIGYHHVWHILQSFPSGTSSSTKPSGALISPV